MLNEMGFITATFTAPENIGVDKISMLWMFPLLASIAIVYKASKMRVIFLAKFFKESTILFFTLIVFMTLTGLALLVIVHLLTK